jgi:hypothetical protein
MEHGSLSLNSLAYSLGNLGTRKKTYNRTTPMNAKEIQFRELDEENDDGVWVWG